MAEIRSFRDLNVYQKAREAAQTIFKLPNRFQRKSDMLLRIRFGALHERLRQ